MDHKIDKFEAFKAQALDDCLAQIELGASLEEALKTYGNLAEELRPLVETALANLSYTRSLDPPAAAVSLSRAKFLNAAQAAAGEKSPGWLSGILFSRLAFAAAAFLLVILIGGFSSVAASAQSLPGDWLYPVKLASEQTRLFLTADPLARLNLEQVFDSRRAEEILALQQSNRSEMVRLAGEVQDIRPGMWQVRNIRVLVHTGTQIEEDIEVGFYVEVNGSLQPDGTVLAESIRTRRIEFFGTVEVIAQDHWVVDGLTIKVTARTQWSGDLAVGNQVEVGAFVLADGSLQAYSIQEPGSNETAVTWTETPTISPTVTPTLTATPTATQSPVETEETEDTETPNDGDKEKDDDSDNERNKEDDDRDNSGSGSSSSGNSTTSTSKSDDNEEPDD
jgi:hypothetical protein